MDYRITQIDAELWKQVKNQAAYEGRSLRFVLLTFLRLYAKHGFAILELANEKKP